MEKLITIQKKVDIRFIVCDLGVRYWEDGTVNGIDDSNDNPTIPGVYTDSNGKKRLRLRINADTGEIADWPKGTTASVHYKVCDDGVYTLVGENEEIIKKVENYVPDILCPKEYGYGDYVILDIDANGHIEDWDMSDWELQQFIDTSF